MRIVDGMGPSRPHDGISEEERDVMVGHQLAWKIDYADQLNVDAQH